MTCREVTTFLMDYLDGAMAAEARAVFERHLDACLECREYLHSYETTVRLARSAYRDAAEDFVPSPPAELVAAILASRGTPGPSASRSNDASPS